jgi:hypothetical protein
MGAAVIPEQDLEAIGKGVGEGLHQDMQGLRTQIRSFEPEALPHSRGHRAIDSEPFADGLDRAHGLATAGCEAPSTHAPEAHAAFILTNPPHRAGILGRDEPLPPLWTGSLQHRDDLRGFYGGWAAAP